MWSVSRNNISMTVGDFGVALAARVKGIELGDHDSIKIKFKTAIDGETVLEKVFTDIQNSSFGLILSADDSARFDVGTYVYSMDWYRDGVFMCNIIPCASFKVVKKA